MFRPLSREEEPIAFRPVAGYEEGWAQHDEPELQPVWLYLGTYPLVCFWCLWMALLGSVLIGG
jgi:hypothetical protein